MMHLKNRALAAFTAALLVCLSATAFAQDSQPTSQPASQPASKPASQPASQPAPQPEKKKDEKGAKKSDAEMEQLKALGYVE